MVFGRDGAGAFADRTQQSDFPDRAIIDNWILDKMRTKNVHFDALNVLQDLLSFLNLTKGTALFCSFLILVVLVSLLCWMAHYVARRYFADLIHYAVMQAKPIWGKSFQKHKLIHRLALLGPALVIYLTAPFFAISSVRATASFVALVILLNQIYLAIVIGMALDAFLHTFEDIYNTYSVANRAPIKSYMQITRIMLFICIVVVIISLLLDLSPWTFFTGLGAATAVILLIFRDVILGFVASIHLSSYDIVRLGDWIEVSQLGIDGNVIEISLTTVKIRNFDKTFTAVPTYSLISTGVKNWRGMRESGGRRIKRSINIAMRSIRFVDQDFLERMQSIDLIRDYAQSQLSDLEGVTDSADTSALINNSRTTNIGLFRNYLSAYLKKNKSLHKHGFDSLVRELQPTDGGLPIEIYVFSTSTDLETYENLQAEIFDHIIASLKYFDLELFVKI